MTIKKNKTIRFNGSIAVICYDYQSAPSNSEVEFFKDKVDEKIIFSETYEGTLTIENAANKELSICDLNYNKEEFDSFLKSITTGDELNLSLEIIMKENSAPVSSFPINGKTSPYSFLFETKENYLNKRTTGI